MEEWRYTPLSFSSAAVGDDQLHAPATLPTVQGAGFTPGQVWDDFETAKLLGLATNLTPISRS
jgi:hypothetical protein